MSTLPEFTKDVTGEYGGNAYPEQTEYRLRIEQVGDGTEFMLWSEDTSGNPIGNFLFNEEVAVDGIIAMAEINHDLNGYEDDWSLPAGMYRTLGWVIPNTPLDVDIRIDEEAIDEIAHWLRFALGLDEYDGPEDRWEW